MMQIAVCHSFCPEAEGWEKTVDSRCGWVEEDCIARTITGTRSSSILPQSLLHSPLSAPLESISMTSLQDAEEYGLIAVR